MIHKTKNVSEISVVSVAKKSFKLESWGLKIIINLFFTALLLLSILIIDGSGQTEINPAQDAAANINEKDDDKNDENDEMLKNLRIHSDLKSQFLTTARNVLIYLPPGYHKEKTRRYPVLYLQDGQNLFDPATAFIRGNYWRCGETANLLIKSGQIEPIIIVGINNAGTERINEYTPSRDARHNAGGQADLYGRFLVEELKPFIDSQYRTLSDAEHTGLGGSSLGGLVTLYLGMKYPEVFQRLAVISPSIWWDNHMILHYLRSRRTLPHPRIWLDMGTREGPRALMESRMLRDLLLSRGWRRGKYLRYLEVRGGQHSEVAWAKRFDKILKFLYPVKKKTTKSTKKNTKLKKS